MFWIKVKMFSAAVVVIALILSTAIWASELPSPKPASAPPSIAILDSSSNMTDADATAVRKIADAFCDGLVSNDADSIDGQFSKAGLARSASFLSLYKAATRPDAKRRNRLLKTRSIDVKGNRASAYITLDPSNAETEAEKTTVKAFADLEYLLRLSLIKEGFAWKIDELSGPPQDPHDIADPGKFSPEKSCQRYAEAQEIYHRKDHTGNGVMKYADSLILLHKATDSSSGFGEQTGLLDAAFALAEVGGAVNAIPLHGYCFKILKGQGASVRASTLGPTLDGRHSYIDKNGDMTLGYALVAFPANYDSESQAQLTYMISCHGLIYHKDLGPNTRVLAENMTEFDPDLTWTEER